jgi:mitochondrial fission protein ELM1
VCHILTAVVSNKVIIWHWEHSSNPILDKVFVMDLIVSTKHSISKAREIFETLLFVISLEFGHFVRLCFCHAIEVFIWI